MGSAHIYDLALSPEALKAAAGWATFGIGPEEITLIRIGSKLLVRQGRDLPEYQSAWMDSGQGDERPLQEEEVQITVATLAAAAEWVTAGPDMADVYLLADGQMLLVYQGDNRAGFDTDGSAASEEYLAVAPLGR